MGTRKGFAFQHTHSLASSINTSYPGAVEYSCPSLTDYDTDTTGGESSVLSSMPDPSLYMGQTFDDLYEDMQVVMGEGAFGSVRVCRHLESGKEFAVKVIAKTGPISWHKVWKEIDICLAFEHCKSIVNLVDSFEDTDAYYLVFEKMNGGDFHSLLESREYLSEREAAHVMAELASAVEALHSRGIAHRDIKPDNVLCHTPGEATPLRLCDFDLAGGFPYHFPADITRPEYFSSVIGTAEYIAPEVLSVWAGKPSACYDKNCDLWSLGVFLYAMLFGDLPFQGNCRRPDCPGEEDFSTCVACDALLIEAIRRGDYHFPRAKGRKVSNRAKDLIKHLLVLEPSARISASDILKHPFVTAHRDSECRQQGETTPHIMAPHVTHNARTFSSSICLWEVTAADTTKSSESESEQSLPNEATNLPGNRSVRRRKHGLLKYLDKIQLKSWTVGLLAKCSRLGHGLRKNATSILSRAVRGCGSAASSRRTRYSINSSRNSKHPELRESL